MKTMFKLSLLALIGCGGTPYYPPQEDNPKNPELNGGIGQDTVPHAAPTDEAGMPQDDAGVQTDAPQEAGQDTGHCVHPADYFEDHKDWKVCLIGLHYDALPSCSLQLGALVYSEDRCLDLLEQAEHTDNDASLTLAAALITALENGGANDPVVMPFVQISQDWLLNNAVAGQTLPYHTSVNSSAGVLALELAHQLEIYNDGKGTGVSPPACPHSGCQ